MKREAFTLDGISESVKEKVLRVLRLISGSEKEDSNVCTNTPTFIQSPNEPFNLTSNHLSEAERRKAEALMHLQMFEHPK
jgi:hypothetical protein